MLAFLALYDHNNLSQRYGPGLAHQHRNFPWPIPLLQPRALLAPLLPVPPQPPSMEPPGLPPPFQSRHHHHVPNDFSAPAPPLPDTPRPNKRAAVPSPSQYCNNCHTRGDAPGAHWTDECPSDAPMPRPEGFKGQTQKAECQGGKKRPSISEQRRRKLDRVREHPPSGEVPAPSPPTSSHPCPTPVQLNYIHDATCPRFPKPSTLLPATLNTQLLDPQPRILTPRPLIFNPEPLIFNSHCSAATGNNQASIIDYQPGPNTLYFHSQPTITIPQPSTHDPQPSTSTFNPLPSTVKLLPSTINPQPWILNCYS